MFRLAAFLLAPLFFFLLALLFLVIRVRDAIFFSSARQSVVFRLLFLAFCVSSVKESLALNSLQNHLILAVGEQKVLDFKASTNFSIGNKEVLSPHLDTAANQLLLKGLKPGFSDIHLWGKKGGKKTIQAYVYQKKQALLIAKLTQKLSSKHLQVTIREDSIWVSGTVKQIHDYQNLIELKAKYDELIKIEALLDPEFKKKIVGEIYQKLFLHKYKNSVCHSQQIFLTCYVSYEKKSSFLKKLEKDFHISILKKKHHLASSNLKLEMKLILLEKLDGEEINLGLDRIMTNVESLYQEGLKGLISKNLIWLEKNKTKISTIAQPQIMISLGEKQRIQIGSEVAFQNLDQPQQQLVSMISWRFAGLKIKTHIVDKKGRLFLDYETEFTTPSAQSISGNKEKSSLYLNLNHPTKLFQITFQSISNKKISLPFLGDIPILKNLFQSTSHTRNYKQIIGYIKITKG